VFDPIMCKSPDVPLQGELQCLSFVVGLHVICGQLDEGWLVHVSSSSSCNDDLLRDCDPTALCYW